MNMKLVTTAAFIAALALVAPSANAFTAAQAKAVKKAVTSVPAPEMPAKAAELVKSASKEDREGTAVAAVRAAIYKSRTSAPLVVSAIVKAAPEVAGAVTLAATEMERGQAGYIKSAAITAAPSAKNVIIESANRGAALAAAAQTAPATSTTLGSTLPSVGTSVTLAGNTRSTITRGQAGGGGGAAVTQSTTTLGGGSFAGEDPEAADAPQEVGYEVVRQ